MSKPNHTTNSGKHFYLRDDLWAGTYFDFLLKPGITAKYRRRIMKIKNYAKKVSKQPSSKYPNERK